MGDGANLQSIDALRLFRVALIKFIDGCNTALNDAESEMRNTQTWLEHEQYNYWQNQIRKREELVSRAKEAVRMKKVFKDSAGRQQSAIDEEKALRISQLKLEEAQQKFVNVKRYTRVMQKEIEVYKGSAQRFATTLQSDLPQAAAMLDQMMAALDAYVSYGPADGIDPTKSSTAPTEGQPEQTG